MPSSYMADEAYGPDPTAQQPSDTAVPEHAGSGRAEPVAKTVDGRNLGHAHSPVLAIVVLLGLALLLLNLVSR